MHDPSRTSQDLIEENSALKQKITELEQSNVELKAAEKTLRKSVHQWTDTFDAINDSICLISPEGRIIKHNKATERLLGKSASELDGHFCFEVVHGISEPLADCPLQRMKNTKRRESKAFQRGDRWLEVTTDPILDDDQQIVTVIHIIADITDHRKAEEGLQESELRMHQIVDNAPFGVHLYKLGPDQRLIFIGANRAADSILKVNNQQFIGKTIEEAFPSLAQTDIPDAYRRVADTGRQYDTMQVDYAEGAIRGAFEVRAFQTAPNRMATFFRDITESKRAEEALRESERRLKMIVEHVNDAFYIHDFQGNITDLNDNACKMTGYNRDELLNGGLPLIDTPENSNLMPIRMSRLIRDGFVVFEGQHKRKDGTVVEVNVSVRIVSIDGKGIVQSFVSDITDRKRDEQELRKSKALLLEMTTQVPGVVYQFYARPNGEMGFYYVSDRSEQILGIKPDLEGYFERFTALVMPEHREGFLKSIENSVKEASEWKYEGMLQKPSGEKIWFSGNSTPSLRENEMVFNGIVSDITDRKQTETELRKNEKDLTETQNISHIGNWRLDLATNRVVWSEELYKMYGFDPALPPPPYTEHQKLFTPESWELLSSSLTKTRDTGIPYELELRTVREDGRNGWMWVRGETVLDEKGKTVGLWGAAQDITERKQVESRLREEQGRISTILATVGDPIFVKDNDHRFVLANRAFYDMFGLEEEDVIGKTMGETLPADEMQHFFAVDRQVLDSGIPDLREEILTAKNGVKLTIITRKTRFLDDAGNSFLVGAIHDITGIKQTEEALKISETKSIKLFQSSPVMMALSIRHDGTYLDVNQSFLDNLGYQREEVIGKTSTSLGILRVEDHQRLINVLAEKNSVKNVEVLFHSKSDMPIHGLLSAEAIKLGEVDALLTAVIDITDRKEAEAARRLLEDRLQRAEKMEALGTMAGGVAHDLNNVLGVVVGFAELLLDGVDEKSPIRKGLLNIMQGGERAAAIVQDLLTLARRGVTGKQILNLNKIISDNHNSPEFEKLTASHSAVRISIDLEPDLLNIAGSSIHLGKTLFNLISNAVEAMPEGGNLIIKTANHYLDKPIQGYDEVREGDYVVLSVSDTGEGIPAENRKRIFEPFYTKKIMGRSGTGLGLAVVWGTIKDHNGYINVESEEGKGSTFTLYFPVAREELSSESAPICISEYMGNSEFILVVDDVQGQRELATSMLGKLNYTVSSASSGEEAVAYLKAHTIDLIILDMIMDPGMDGLDTYKKILEINPTQKAIIVSGFSESDRVHAAQVLGAGDYVKKPYVIEKLGMAVRKELDRT